MVNNTNQPTITLKFPADLLRETPADGAITGRHLPQWLLALCFAVREEFSFERVAWQGQVKGDEAEWLIFVWEA